MDDIIIIGKEKIQKRAIEKVTETGCLLCGKQFEDIEELIKHISISHPKVVGEYLRRVEK